MNATLARYETEMVEYLGDLLDALADTLAHDDTPPHYETELREAKAAFDAFPPRSWWRY